MTFGFILTQFRFNIRSIRTTI